MDRPVFFLDGISFQRAGELFFETRQTLEEQRACPSSYRRSLEDFAMALVFGNGVAVGRLLPEVAPDTIPGEYLRRYIGQFASPIDDAGKGGKPEDFLGVPEEKSEAIRLISQLEPVRVSEQFVYWTELAVREARHLGNDRSLFRHQTDPTDYEFKKRFVEDLDLRNAVPPRYLDSIISHVRRVAKVDARINDDALRVFFAENASAHILIYAWYIKVIPEALENVRPIYNPHATRAALTPSNQEKYRLRLPSVLHPILQRAERPIDVLDELLYLTIKRHHRELGEALGEFCEHGDRGREDKARIAAAKSTRLARKYENTTQVRISFPRHSTIEGRPWPPRNNEAGPEFRQGSPLISPMATGAGLDFEYERDFARIFRPERKRFFHFKPKKEVPADSPQRLSDRSPWYEHLAAKFRFWHEIGARDVEGFVDQFPAALHSGVLRMLRSISLYLDADFDAYYRQFVRRHPDLFSPGTVVCPLDTSGGSASLMGYMSGHCLKHVRHLESLSSALTLRQRHRPKRIVLLDDATITGTQVVRIFQEYFGQIGAPEHVQPLTRCQRSMLLSGKIELILLFVLAPDEMTKSVAREIRRKLKNLTVEVLRIAPIDRRALFRDRAYIFGELAQKAKKFFAKVGRSILRDRAKRKVEGIKKQSRFCSSHALGFGNQELLVVYSYNVPKPTITLLWEKGTYRGRPWKPLFPIREAE